MQEGAYIDGAFINASKNETLKVVNPANGEVIASISDCGASEAEMALGSAVGAFKDWSGMPANERATYIRKWYDLVKDAEEDMSRLVTLESGKPIVEARAEVATGTESIAWCAEEARRVCGEVLPFFYRDKRFITMRQPIGVVFAITPWNFPFSMVTRKVAPALAAGCTVCLKPSELTPLTALALAEMAGRAGIPPGVLNVIPGTQAAKISEVFMKSNEVRKLTFTGSTQVRFERQIDI